VPFGLENKIQHILLGATSGQQSDQNLVACKSAATSESHLPSNLLAAFARGRKLTREGAFKYWQSYLLDRTDGENLDQGAQL
jgi:hypothetical protein